MIFFPFQITFHRDVESTHVSHVPHVNGHILFTPSHEQRKLVDLDATNSQDLVIFFPSGLIIMKRSGESLQKDNTDGEEEVIGKGAAETAKVGLKDGS